MTLNQQPRKRKVISYRLKRLALASLLSIGIYGTVTSSFATAQTTDATEETKTEEENSQSQPITVFKLKAAAEPTPSLRYRFWPSRLEMQQGNAFVRFQRAILLAKLAGANNVNDDYWTDSENWLSTPIDELDKESARHFLKKYRAAIDEAHAAKLIRNAEYELEIDNLRGLRALDLPLPEFQEMRSLARLLQLEIRLQLAEGKVDEAIETLRTGFRLGEAVSQATDFAVGSLIGLSITRNMLSEVEKCIQQDGCPNLYWALATLPESSIEPLHAAQFESTTLSRLFPLICELPEESVTTEDWRARLVQSLAVASAIGNGNTAEGPSEDDITKAKLLAGAAIAAQTESSRQQLIDAGFTAERVAQMSPEEAIVRATALSIQQIEDDYSKWTLLPQTVQHELTLRWKIGSIVGGQDRAFDVASTLASVGLLDISLLWVSSNESKKQLAWLITIEAIRNHVAIHGVVPENLESMEDLPAWPNPAGGELFAYEKQTDRSAFLYTPFSNWILLGF